jgi:hypothetical protein
MMNAIRRCGLGLALLLGALPAMAETIRVLSYHDFPPFLDAQGGGLSKELCELLTRKSDGRYQFTLQITSRRRLDAFLAKPDASAIVAWVSPDFFPHPEQFKWGPPLMADSVMLVTLPGTPAEIGRAESFRGLRFGAMPGHLFNYPGISEALKSGALRRIDASSPGVNYSRLLHGSIDLTIMAESTLHFLHESETERPHTVEQQLPTTVYHRSYFTVNASPDLQQFLRQQLDTLRVVRGTQPAWRIQSMDPK